MAIYREIVDVWLSGLASRLQRRALMPLKLKAALWRADRGEPVWDRYFVALPAHSQCEAEIAYRNSFVDDVAFAEMYSSIIANRAQLAGRLNPGLAQGIVEPFGSWPGREFAYGWLSEDLFKCGWSSTRRSGAFS